MWVGLSAKYCYIFFNVDQINQWYLSNNEASCLPIYFEQIEREIYIKEEFPKYGQNLWKIYRKV